MFVLRRRAVLLVIAAALSAAQAAGARVLRVGSYHGIRGQYQTVQAAVNAAHTGDWILIGPGDYKTAPKAISSPNGYAKFPEGARRLDRQPHRLQLPRWLAGCR